MKGFDDGLHSIWHILQFSRQHLLLFCPDEKGTDNVRVTSPDCCIPVEKRKGGPISKKSTGTALSSRNESVSSLSSSREPPIKT